jgi:3-oxoacyl-[acyl-carrier-protein] synthase-3
MAASKIKDISCYIPEAVLDNNSLASIYEDWSAEKILSKTGISHRHIAADNETATDMAISAAENLFAKGKVCREEIDFVIFCTQAPDYILPTSACLIQHALNLAKNVGALDINLGCSGFVYALSLANGLINAGTAKCVLILTSDTYSKFIHPLDKSVRTLFGDAAAAIVVTATMEDKVGIGPFIFGTDGAGAKSLIVETGGSRTPRTAETSVETIDSSGNVRSRDNLYMDGAAVMNFALREVPRSAQALREQAGIGIDDVDFYVLHQANQFMLEALRKKLGISSEKLPLFYKTVGNTVSSTIPLVLNEMIQANTFYGRKIMLIGFGVGLSWAACILDT